MTHVVDLTYAVWAYLTAGWTDISDDVISGTVSGMDGFLSNRPADRIAATGQFEFALKNLTGKYSPGHGSSLAGWKTNIPVKLIFSYLGFDYPIYGRIAAAPDGIRIDAQDKGMPRVIVTVTDWFDRAGKDPVTNPGVLSDKRGDEVITQALSLAPIAPLTTDLDTGVNIFPTVFDVTTSTTKIYNELARVALSEMGYIYLKHDTTYGETLVFENWQARNGLRAETRIVASYIPDIFYKELREDGGYELREDGGYQLLDDVIIVDDVFDGDNTYIRADISHGANLINRMSIYANPRKVDSSPVVLFRLSQPFQIGSGQTFELKGTYADPSGGLPVNGQNMITPAATTDYLMNTASDGSGTNLTASLTVSAAYGSEGFTHQLTNTSNNTGWVTLFNCRGYGIYNYNPIEHVATESISVSENGTFPESINQKYQKTLDFGRLMADSIAYFEKDPETRFDKVSFIANYSPEMMYAFLRLGVGDMIRLKSSKANIDAYYFIQGRDWEILQGRLVMFNWTVKEHLSLSLGLSLVAAEMDGYGGNQSIDFGYLPHASKLASRTISFWFYADGFPIADNFFTNKDFYSGSGLGGCFTDLGSGFKKRLRFQSTGFSITSGEWVSTNDVIPTGQWLHFAATYTPQDVAVDPILYVNGAAIAITETSTPSGTYIAQENGNTVLGSPKTPAFQSPYNGKIKDARIYNRILSSSEIAQIYSEGAGGTGVTSGMVFQGPVVKTKDLAYFTDHTMLSTDRVAENIYQMIGKPTGSPIIRLS